MKLIMKFNRINLKNILAMISIVLFMWMYSTASAKTEGKIIVKSGETWSVTETTKLNSLTVFDGGIISVPDGCSLTMTVDGVETGQKLVTTAGVETQITPGIYRGDIVITITEKNIVPYQGLNFPLRQALYLDKSGVVEAKSVLSAVDGEKPRSFNIDDISFKSTGECFNRIYAAGGDYTLNNIKINLIDRSEIPKLAGQPIRVYCIFISVHCFNLSASTR